MRTALIVPAAAVVAALALSACNRTDPCATLSPPTQAELTAANGGAQVEREISQNVECDLINGRWVREGESSRSHSTRSTTARNTRKPTTTKSR